MFRDVAIIGAAAVVLQVSCPGAHAAPAAANERARAHHDRLTSIRLEAAHWATVHAEPARRNAEPVRRVAAPDRRPAALVHEVAIRTEPVHHRLVFRRAVAEAAFRPAEPMAANDAAPPPMYRLPAPTVDQSAGAPTSLAYRVPPPDAAPADALPAVPPKLSAQEAEASQLAAENGDRQFLMVDKALGKILMFENGRPVFAGPALTGESTADDLPPGELTKKFDNLYALNTKVTPAGRFTVQHGFDKELGGDLLDVSEIRGKDWGIAIHSVYLGTPSEHRDVRIASPGPEDKHISFGCINVTPAAIRYLLRVLPAAEPTPLYILPEDPAKTAEYFAPRTS